MPKGIATRVKQTREDIAIQTARREKLRQMIIEIGSITQLAYNLNLSATSLRSWVSGERRIDDEYAQILGVE